MLPTGTSINPSATATGEAKGGTQGGSAFGDFNFKSSSGLSTQGGGTSPNTYIILLVIFGGLLWSRKR